MTSTASESSEIWSPTGSVLITRDFGNPRPRPLRYLTDYTTSSFESALEEQVKGVQEVQGLSNSSTVPRSQREDSGDWITWDTVDPALVGLTLDVSDSAKSSFSGSRPEGLLTLEKDSTLHEEAVAAATAATQPPHTHFNKWMRTLRRRAGRQPNAVTTDDMPSASTSVDSLHLEASRPGHHRQSSSGSSFGFVEAVKTASVSLASVSVFARARRNSMRSSRAHTHTDRSSRGSISSHRCSEDSCGLDRPQILDKAAVERSLQRRRILEELISTEEGYIGDVRFLMNVYVTILVSLPTMPQGLRSSINRNLADIVDLHEELLGELHRAVPYSEYTQTDLLPGPKSVSAHRRIRSLNVVPEDNESISWLETVPGMIAEPNVVADVAKAFTKKMNRFFVYEEYGAKYEMMIKDIASAHRTMPQWETYQKGLETLASSVGPSSFHGDKSKKSLTIGDLLVKPIQRVCKYPLLFAELLKYTPVADSPYAHMEIESALIRLRETTAQINRATDDARVKAVLEKTWLLQDRLVFPDSKLDAASKKQIRSFGHIQLCGVLHACWQSKEGVQGQYSVALLYKDWLCLASASKFDLIYTLQACIPLSQIKVEAVDNGRGLQCHTCPFSWKIVFECDCQLYEIMLTACTTKEEDEWRSRLELGAVMSPQEPGFSDLNSSVFLDIKSLGTFFGKQGTIARKISIHRATTFSPRSPLCNVILRNTSLERDPQSSINATINRSQSLLVTKSRVPVLAPSRGDRARLEALLSDVWTREILPFPGLTVRARNEHLIRTSAHSMMRKLSVTSIASQFTKRSASLASITRGGSDEESGGEDDMSMLTTTLTNTSETVSALGTHLDHEGNRNTRLSVIEDDSDRTPSTIRARTINPVSSVGSSENLRSPRRRIRIAKSPSAWQLRDAGIGAGSASRLVSSSPSTPGAIAALRTRSANGPQVNRQASLLSRKSVRSVCSAVDGGNRSAKERMVAAAELGQFDGAMDGLEDPKRSSSRYSASPPKSSSPEKSSVNRWSRVDLLRRGSMAQGIRGFFR